MRRGAEISCLAWAGRDAAALSMPPLVCCPEPALALKMSPHLAQALAKLGKPQDPNTPAVWAGLEWAAAWPEPDPALGSYKAASTWHPSPVCDRALQGAGAAGWHLWASGASG